MLCVAWVVVVVVGSGVVVDLTGIAMSASMGEAIVNQSDVLKKQQKRSAVSVCACVCVWMYAHMRTCVCVCLLMWV